MTINAPIALVSAGAADTSGWLSAPVAAALIAFVAALMAAATAAYLARKLKISEFRQAWIVGLRTDIATYIGAISKWYVANDRQNFILKKIGDEHDFSDEIAAARNEAVSTLARIRLCFNPDPDSADFAEDEAFLATLRSLLDESHVVRLEATPIRIGLMDEAVRQGRVILKREWEVTKSAGFTWLQPVGHRSKLR